MLAKRKEDAVRWAQEVVRDGNTVFLDTETTGLGPTAEIVDIGVVALDGTVLLDRLVKPRNPIPAAATAVHGITDEMVSSADLWRDVYGSVAELIARRGHVIVYNLQYDFEMLNLVSAAEQLPTFATIDATWQCAMKAYSEFDGTLGRYGDLKWHKLDAAAQRFGITPGGHRALADAEATRQLVIAMAGIEVPPIPEANEHGAIRQAVMEL